jgi:hypothetical protein
MTVIPGAPPEPEKVTVPADEPKGEDADDDSDDSSD